MSRSELVFAVFFQIKRSILSSQGLINFRLRSMDHAPRKKSLEELKAEAIAELERRGLSVRGKTPAQIRKLLRLRFQKTKFKSNRNSPGGPIIETRRPNSD